MSILKGMSTCDYKCLFLGEWVNQQIKNNKEDISLSEMVTRILKDYPHLAELPGISRAVTEALYRANILNQLPYDKTHNLYKVNSNFK